MKVFFGIRNISAPPKSAVVTIGTYDGVHKGHQSILSLVRERARALGGTPIVFTFDPHPAQVLFPKQSKPLLTALQRRLKLFSYHGIEWCVIEKFDALLARISAEEFVDQYILLLQPAEVIVGYNFTFGRGAGGDVHFLRERLIAQGVRLTVVDPVEIDGAPCSSSRIRALLSEGRLLEAHRLLGRYHSVTGKVVLGKGRGQKMGFPTANLEIPAKLLLPKRGVYVIFAVLEDELFGGAANIGWNPTFADRKEGELVLEAHLFDLHKNLLNQEMTLYFVQRLRDEEKFASAGELAAQIERDCAAARKILSLT